MTFVPIYEGPGLPDVASLAVLLGQQEVDLYQIASDSQKCYRRRETNKRTGGKRTYFVVAEILKSIQHRIVETLLNRVIYPPYLQGGVKDFTSPRDYLTDAKLHANARTILKRDVRDFFHSIPRWAVVDMWKSVFRSGDDVADILADLTTYRGFVPQGAPTSVGICNLIFGTDESDIYRAVEKMGMVYSRYVDDITVSSPTVMTIEQKVAIDMMITALLSKYALVENRKKRTSHNSSGPMPIHGVNINSGRTTVPRNDRSRIRSEVHHFCKLAQDFDQDDATVATHVNQLKGKLATFRRLHPTEANALLRRVDAAVALREERNRLATSMGIPQRT